MSKESLVQVHIWGIVVTLACFAFLAVFVDVGSLQAYVVEAGVWAPLMFIGLKILTVVVAPISGSPLYPLVGLLFGFFPGFFYVLIGDFIGYTIAFTLSRLFGRPLVMRFISMHEEGMVARIMKHMGTTKGVLHMCLACLAAPEIVAYAGGLSRIPYWKLMIMLMPAAGAVGGALVLFGSLLDHTNDQSLLISLGLPLVGLAIMASGGYLFLRSIKKLGGVDSSENS